MTRPLPPAFRPARTATAAPERTRRGIFRLLPPETRQSPDCAPHTP